MTSCHPFSIHKAWPLAEMRRVYSLASCRSQFFSARNHLVSRRSRFGLTTAVTNALSWHPPLKLEREARSSRNVVRLVCPFHPSLPASGFHRCIQDCLDLWRLLLSDLRIRVGAWTVPDIQVSWSVKSKPFWLVLRNLKL